VQLDALVRGLDGKHTDRFVEGRVFAIRPTFVGIIMADGKQGIINEPEVVGPPRPVFQRTDIPSRLTR
jgi:hypothetical protein